MKRKFNSVCTALLLSAAMLAMPTQAKAQDAREGYKGVPRTQLFTSLLQEVSDTSAYKKEGPYVIGFSNASINNSWRLGFHHAVLKAAADHKDLIKQLIVTDANDNPTKQIADIQDLIQRGVDLLIVSAATADALDPVVTRAMEQGIPVVMVDRRVRSDNFVSFVTASNSVSGRIMAQWLAEEIGGKGNVIMFTHDPHPGVRARAEAAAAEFANYPEITVIEKKHIEVPGPVDFARNATQDLLTAYPNDGDIAGIWAGWDEPALGATQAIEAAGRTGIAVVGIDGTDFARAEIAKGGPFVASIAQDFDGMAQQLAAIIAASLNGEQPASETVQIPGVLVTGE